MLNDREFLMWIHERLENVHGDSNIADYMHQLRAIIMATSPGYRTKWTGTSTLEQLKELL